MDITILIRYVNIINETYHGKAYQIDLMDYKVIKTMHWFYNKHKFHWNAFGTIKDISTMLMEFQS